MINSKRAMQCVANCLIGGVMLAPVAASAQSLADIKPFEEPLVLQNQGSFFVGGRTVQTEDAGFELFIDAFGLGDKFEEGDIVVDQSYVQFQSPQNVTHTPIVLTHGGLLSSKTWQTTPDGRTGWDEYFVRAGFPTYLLEQAGRARSGFNPLLFNQVKRGKVPPEKQPLIYLGTSNLAWKVFRFGPEIGEANSGLQFPVDHLDEFYKQVIPDMIETEVPSFLGAVAFPETDNPTIDNLAMLAHDLDGAILVGHSQSANFPAQAALRNKGGVKGIIQLDTGCFAKELTEEQAKILAGIPILIVTADYVKNAGASCAGQIEAIKAAGGDVTFTFLPDIGIKGNSHMLMLDKNNLEVADVLIDWISKHVDNKM